MPIVLVGMPGSGKTKIGMSLARFMGRVFYDSDEIIAEQTGSTIGEIFREKGEGEFRKAEHRVISHLLNRRAAVISVGGER